MADLNGPTIVRRSQPVQYVKPGLHSYNARRRNKVVSSGLTLLHRLRVVLLLVGLCGVGYYAYTVTDQYVYQAYQNWAFDQQIAGRRGVTFADYVRERTPFGFLAGRTAAEIARTSEPAVPSTEKPAVPPPGEIARPVEGSLLGRLEISRLNLSAMVREGVDSKTLSIAVGHVPSTALPGQEGNFAIAAHRDTLFRALKDIRKDDLVTFHSPSASYTYRVAATRIVKPSDVSVLRADGGGLIPASTAANKPGADRLLTMITCYPFYYVGSAPKRFIVEAQLVSSDAGEKAIANGAQNTGAAAPPPAAEVRRPASRPDTAHRSVSRLRKLRTKKHGFWHKVFHLS